VCLIKNSISAGYIIGVKVAAQTKTDSPKLEETILGRPSQTWRPLDDRDQKRDPARHIPRFYLTLQRVLGLQLGAAVTDCVV